MTLILPVLIRKRKKCKERKRKKKKGQELEGKIKNISRFANLQTNVLVPESHNKNGHTVKSSELIF